MAAVGDAPIDPATGSAPTGVRRSMSDDLDTIRDRIAAAKLADERTRLAALATTLPISRAERARAREQATELVRDMRRSTRPHLMDSLLSEYGLGTPAGTALLRLAEALMRVPDATTADRLIRDKIVGVNWQERSGASGSLLASLAAHALSFTSWCLGGSPRPGASAAVRNAIKSASMPVMRICVRGFTQRLAGRFVHGETIKASIKRARARQRERVSYSYDMLGEAALTRTDADRFFDDYRTAILTLQEDCNSPDFRDNPGISIKLSALHPRYEQTQRERVLRELGERVGALARMAKDATMGLNIDAEEADRLELSLDVIEQVLRRPDLAGWDGFGIVVQAYNKAAPDAIDFLYRLASDLDRKLMIRLVKGAYWDTEIKRAQIEGVAGFPVYTDKAATDVSYLRCARKLLGMTDRIYPQFASHNAHTVSMILAMADGQDDFEFQHIHGMGDALHDRVLRRHGLRRRIYAPVGQYRELLPYLARRMLENGANVSFVNQIIDTRQTVEEITADPFTALEAAQASNIPRLVTPGQLFAPQRDNSQGWDLHDPATLERIEALRTPHRSSQWTGAASSTDPHIIANPARPAEIVGSLSWPTEDTVATVLNDARLWDTVTAQERARILECASRLYEENAGEIFALLCREAGKTLRDAAGELREAVDFLRFYAAEAIRLDGARPCGLVACISPWNFPLAIFTGQIAGALASGNAVIAKPAEQTPLIANLAVKLLHAAGVPEPVLQVIHGAGETVGRALTGNPALAAIAFTGSTHTARIINRQMAKSLAPHARLVAETGGLNAMIVDSTALPEQAIQDILVSAFQSAGQRCSALRMLYIQDDIYPAFTEMLFGAMDELTIGDPWDAATDVGPLIDAAAHQSVAKHIEAARKDGRLLKQCHAPDEGYFIPPTVIEVSSIADLREETFGPVLHVTRFALSDLDRILDAINHSGYGLTFGLHSRIDARVDHVTSRIRAGNIYVNRNQIGAVVGSQPFGGEGLSGTGPKAGGPHYIAAFHHQDPMPHISPHESSTGAGSKDAEPAVPAAPSESTIDPDHVQRLIEQAATSLPDLTSSRTLPGPTGETNQLVTRPRGTVLCLGPSAEDAQVQAEQARAANCPAVMVAPGAQGALALPGVLPRSSLATLSGFAAVALWSDPDDLRTARRALASRDGPIIPLVTTTPITQHCTLERHICIDTTAAGGNASLYSELA